MCKTLVSVLLYIVWSTVPIFSQDSSQSSEQIFSDTTHACSITLSSGKVYGDVKLFGLGDSTVKIKRGLVSKELLIKDVNSIKFYSKGFGTGALIGGAIGFVIGFTVGGQNLGYSKDFNLGKGLLGGLIVAIPLLLLGGGISNVLTKDQLYDVHDLNFDKKKSRILFLMKKFS